jgi:hypothetical protein
VVPHSHRWRGRRPKLATKAKITARRHAQTATVIMNVVGVDARGAADWIGEVRTALVRARKG